MIKDFDLVINKMDSTHNALSVTNLESYDEAVWYENSIASDSVLNKMMNDFHVEKVIISEENYALIKTAYTLNDYIAFQLHPPVVKKQIAQITENKPQVIKEVESGNKIMDPKIGPVSTSKENTLNSGKSASVTVTKRDDLKSVKDNNQLSDKPIDNPNGKPLDKTVDTKVTNPIHVAEKPISQDTTKTATVAMKPGTEEKTIPEPVIQPKKDDVPLFKGLFAYRANEPHFIAIYIVSGTIDFEKTKAAFNVYNSKNYGLMNLNVSLETINKRQVIIIGSLTDALVAKSYLIRMVKEKSLFEGLKGANYRNLLGSQKNLNVLMQQNALNLYFEFMQMYYLK